MRKSTLLNLALVLMATFMFASANAQILTSYTADESEVMYQTAGRTFRLYTLPDPIYSPTYDPATNANLGGNSQWRFVFSGLTATAPVVNNTYVAQNFVEFTNPSTTGSPFTVVVDERNTLIGCASATTRTTTINVIAAPTAEMVTADATTFCGPQAAQPMQIAFVENVPNNLAAFAFSIEEVVDRIDGSGALLGNVSTNATFLNSTVAAKPVKSGYVGFTAATPDFTLDINTSALLVANVAGVDYRTRYTYTLKKASDAGVAVADGVISAISHKSDFIQGLTSYTFTDNQVVFIVNPAPATGPIYHIPNDYAYY